MTQYTIDHGYNLLIDGVPIYKLPIGFNLTPRVVAALNACDGIDDATLAALPHGALCTAYEVCSDIRRCIDTFLKIA